MKPSALSTALQVCMKARRPTFTWGKPGGGKSQIHAQVAQLLQTSILDTRLCLLDPVDLRGLPYTFEKVTHWAQPVFLPTSGHGILFFDEFVQAPPMMQNAASQLLLDRKIGEYTLPEGWTIAGAGNNMTDRAATQRMPSHIANRWIHLDLETDVDDWSKHALNNGYRLEVVAYNRFKRDALHVFNPQERAFPSPRSWQFVSEILDQSPDPSIELELYEGAIGKAHAAEFTGFLRVWRRMPNLDAIILDPDGQPVPADPATAIAVAGGLARMATETNFDAITRYAARLVKDVEVFCIQAATKRCPDVKNTRAFIQWGALNSDVLS